MEILCFFAGIAFVYAQSFYALSFVMVCLILSPRWQIVVWFAAAAIWGTAHQWWVSDEGIPDMPVIQKAFIEGKVVSIPTVTSVKSQFQFAVTYFNGKPVKATAMLACYKHCPQFKLGDLWRLQVKLKRPANLANPGGFDYVNWLSARHIAWTGYTKREATKLASGENHSKSLLGLRENLASSLVKLIPSSQALGVMEALTLGLTTHMAKEQWDLFRRTGTTHLMVISGAHIGLVAGLSFLLMRWLWSRSSRLCLHCPAAQAASIISLIMAFFYALLAGFAVPAQRSLVACFFLLLKNFLGYRFTAWQAWRYSLLAVLLFEPHAILLPGFYLSFLAVAILILFNQRVSWKGFKKTICLQVACLFGLMPLTLYWFSYGAVNGLIANLLAIPWVGFVIVPLALVSLFLVQYWDNHLLLVPVNWSIDALLYYLNFIDSFSFFNLNFTFTRFLAPLAIMLAMWLILFFPVKAIFPAILILITAAFFPGHPKIKNNEAVINILDVGQGLAVVVRTAKHQLIYDTGVKFYQGGDMGKLAIIPFLHTLGIGKLDKVIISHPDLDHRGGLASLEEKYDIGELVVNNVAFYHRGKNCHHYPAWQWDGVSFQFLAINKTFKNKNNNSCILQISNKGGKILLTGDIEKSAEEYLIAHYRERLASDFLVIPHHGSKTSSSYSFIEQVAPRFAVISAGFDNRYHFPHKETLQTLNERKIKIFNTIDCGMVTVELGTDDGNIFPACYKKGR
ncbi:MULTISPECIES: DNA internalization-related competence protein ComEC/Rec2 [unclassified Legionella]|uniref:DNA internalization-related competence protein ComEC/Rec2 n=1 Tax=unclassified Legionella TaxID=2622702 RepID=UPI00105422F0|nr:MULTISPECIES: DNA internalization-related competence protein ComEC/Rec2 [unclassified Legionella]MDI9818609.1 DNA internalization-related competence protein ComEC/Rec2 [Legionella sp. PL877]